MKEWKHNNYQTINDFFKANNIDPTDVEGTKYYNYDFSKGKNFLLEAIASKKPIYIIGDYDVDGILSTEEMNLIISALGGNCTRYIPRRVSDGYGLSVNIINKIPENAYIITVDNGISAFDAIDLAKKRGMKIMIMDHHLPNDTLPKADIIYDAHIDDADWKDYCATGLVFKFALYLFGNCPFTEYMSVYAAIGTIADSVSMLGDNRTIVKYGLYVANQENIPVQIKLLLDRYNISKLDTNNINFKIAPLINALGRLKDDGSQQMSDYFAERDIKKIINSVDTIINSNEKRKKLSKLTKDKIIDFINKHNLAEKKPIVVYYPEIPEGLIGLLAGNLAEEYKTAVYLISDSSVEGVLKGSARGLGLINVKESLNTCKEALLFSGGHENAGGFSLYAENLDLFKDLLYTCPIKEKENVLVSDFSIKSEDVPMWYHFKNQFEPYGVGIPEPVFYIENFEAQPKYSKFFETNGVDLPGSNPNDPKKLKSNLKLFGAGYDVFGFELTKDYLDINCPKRVQLIGKIQLNQYGNKSLIQFVASGLMKANETDKKPSKSLIFLCS